MKLTIQTKLEINVPVGTKIIRNDDWLTLARKMNGVYSILTCLAEDIGQIEFLDDSNWTSYTKKELTKIVTDL